MKIENAIPVAQKFEVKGTPAKNQGASFKDLISKQTGQVKEALSQQENSTKATEIPVENKAEETTTTTPKDVDLSVVMQMLLNFPQTEVSLAKESVEGNTLVETAVNQISSQGDGQSNVWQMFNMNAIKQAPTPQVLSQSIVQMQVLSAQPQEIVNLSPVLIQAQQEIAPSQMVNKVQQEIAPTEIGPVEKAVLQSIPKAVEVETTVVQTNTIAQQQAKQGDGEIVQSKIIPQEVQTEKVSVEEKPLVINGQVQLKAELPKDITIIKVSDETTKLDHTATTQFANTITTKLSEGKSEFTMQLFPENLGRVAVKLIAENGNIVVQLIADNPKTQSLLLNSSSDIRELVFNSTNTPTTVIATSQQSPMQQNYTSQQDSQKNQGQSHTQQNSQAKPDGETESVDFLSLMQQMNAKSLYHQITM